MMNIYAAQRLKLINSRRVIAKRVPVFAMADEAGARAFIKSVAGISVGTRLETGPSQIQFTIASLEDFRRAKANLIRRYGLPTEDKHAGHQVEAALWQLDSEKSIHLGDSLADRGYAKTPYTVTLMDSAHKETVSQMLKRLARTRR
jgi:hypothetical protein